MCSKPFATMSMAFKYVHNFVSFGFTLGIVLMFLIWVRHNIPNRDDLTWLSMAGGLFTKGKHPPSRKFNAGQKLIFWSVVIFGGVISVSGYPQGAIAELAATSGIELIPIEGPAVDKLLAQYSFFAKDAIPDNAYKGVAGAKTVSVNAQWLTSSKQSEALIYGIVQALWNANTRKLLDAGHAKGKEIKLETALTGIGIPLHPGAEKFYKEKGVLK